MNFQQVIVTLASPRQNHHMAHGDTAIQWCHRKKSWAFLPFYEATKLLVTPLFPYLLPYFLKGLKNVQHSIFQLVYANTDQFFLKLKRNNILLKLPVYLFVPLGQFSRLNFTIIYHTGSITYTHNSTATWRKEPFLMLIVLRNKTVK